jgi:hypothetical protein
MKLRLLLMAMGTLAAGAAWANTEPDPRVPDREKKNELAGVILHGESKKPLKDVVVTAYLVSKKEKTVHTDVTGNYGFDELKPGTYKFVFEKSGYKKVTKEKVVVKTDEAFQLNIEMIENKEFNIVPSPLLFADF